jgi:hypothetical protein
MPRFDEGVEITKLEYADILLTGNPGEYSKILAQNILVEDITRASLQTLITNSRLVRGKLYRITDAVGSTLSIIVQALTANTLGDISYNSATGDIYTYSISTDTGSVGLNLGENGLNTGFVTYDTTPTNTPTSQATTYWDSTEETLALIMNGVTQRVGLDTFFNAKNSTGSSIPKGTAVRFAGTDGNSGNLLIAPMLADGTYPSVYYMGITAEAIGNGQFGKVISLGKLRTNTNAYVDGDVLYVSSTVAGGFQTTAPLAPNNIIIAASVVNAANNGVLEVRATLGSNINNDEGVKITTPLTGQLLQLQSNGLWENKTLPFVQPEWYGAVGDGLTDDTQAIKDAISVLTSAGGGTLVLQKTYLVSSTITATDAIVICGGGTLKRINEIKTTITQNLTVGQLFVNVTSSAGFEIGQEIRIYKAGYNNSNYNTNRMVITDIQGNTIYWAGALSQNFASGDFLITACSMLQLNDRCFVENITFDGNRANNTSFTRWDVHLDCFGLDDTATYTIKDCYFNNGTGDPVLLYGNKVSVLNCKFKDVNGNAIHFSDTNECIVSNCYIENTNLANSATIGHAGGCISFSLVNTNIYITDCILINGIYGVGFTSGSVSSNLHYNAIIKGNTIRNCRTGAMDLRSTTAGVRFDDITIVGNKMYNSGIVDITSTATSLIKKKLIFKDNIIYNGRVSINYVEDCEVSDNKIYNDVNPPESSLVSNDITNTSILVASNGSKKIIIDRNIVYAGRYGIYVSGTTETVGQFSIRNNYVFKSYECGIRVFNAGTIYQWAITHNYIANETDCLSTWDGIGLSVVGLIAYNYVFAQAGRACVFLNSNNGGKIYKNQLYTTSSSIFSVSGFGGTAGCDIVDNIINAPIRTSNIPISSNLITGNTYPGIIKRGTATLVGGTVTVALAGIVAENQVFLTKTTVGGTEGHIRVSITAGVGFTITSSSATDTSTFTWLIQ